MHRSLVTAAAAALWGSVLTAASEGPPFDPAGWVLDMEDEFRGNELNTTLWTPKTGKHTNGEGEWYLPENVGVQNGSLILTAKRSPDPSKTGGQNYTSGWVDTDGKWAELGGRFEASCKFYVGAGGHSEGYWPAYWLMPDHGCWPVMGEIDIMESLGGHASVYGGKYVGEQASHWALHWSADKSTCGSNQAAGGFTPPVPLSGPLYNESFAVFGANMDVARDMITFYINTTTVGSYSGFSQRIAGPSKWHHILNYAVGGSWGGFPTADTVFPTTMQCDWVRHYSPKA